MRTEITIITRDDCTYCEAAKKQLNEASYTYHEMKIGEDISRDDVIAAYPEEKTLPIVLWVEIGGYADLIKKLHPPLNVENMDNDDGDIQELVCGETQNE